MKNILFIVPSLRRGGAETQLIDLVNSLDSKKYCKHLLVFEKELDQLNRIDRNSVKFHRIHRRFKYDVAFIRDLSYVIEKEKIDIVHCTLLFSCLVAALSLLGIKRKPVLLTTIHTTEHRDLKAKMISRVLYGPLLKFFKSVIFVCERQKDEWVRQHPHLLRRSRVVYNGIDPYFYDPVPLRKLGDDFRRQHSIPTDAFLIACIAGFRPEKGHDILVHAFSRMPADCWLILVGDGDLKEKTEQLIKKIGIAERVIFTGVISDVRPLLSASQISVLASTAVETFSIAMLESMSMGVPMVAPDIGGLSEAIIPNHTGLLFEIRDIDGMNSAMMRFYQDRDLLNKAGLKSRASVMEKFQVSIMADRTAYVLDELLI